MPIASGTEPEQYTSDQLISAAVEYGYKPTRRLLTDWVRLGLLDRPLKRGLGRGKGTVAAWSSEQLQLFLLLLSKRQTASRPTLCNIPVALWLIWGEDYASLPQIKRALRTWAGAYGKVSWARARRTAKELVAHMQTAQSPRADREALIELVATAAYGGSFDPKALRETAWRVFDPTGGRRSSKLQASGPDEYVRVIEARAEAVRQLDALEDETYASARVAYGTTVQAMGPVWDGSVTGTLERFEYLTNNACLHLLTLLGLSLLAGRASRTSNEVRRER